MRAPCWFLLLPVLITAVGLAAGAGWLARPTPGWAGLPLGNAATWLSLVCLGGLTLCRPLNGWRRVLAGLALLLALAWGPVSRLVTGNWAFTTSDTDLPLPWGLMSGGVTTLVLLAALTGTLTARRPGGGRAES